MRANHAGTVKKTKIHQHTSFDRVGNGVERNIEKENDWNRCEKDRKEEEEIQWTDFSVAHKSRVNMLC